MGLRKARSFASGPFLFYQDIAEKFQKKPGIESKRPALQNEQPLLRVVEVLRDMEKILDMKSIENDAVQQ